LSRGRCRRCRSCPPYPPISGNLPSARPFPCSRSRRSIPRRKSRPCFLRQTAGLSDPKPGNLFFGTAPRRTGTPQCPRSPAWRPVGFPAPGAACPVWSARRSAIWQSRPRWRRPSANAGNERLSRPGAPLRCKDCRGFGCAFPPSR